MVWFVNDQGRGVEENQIALHFVQLPSDPKWSDVLADQIDFQGRSVQDLWQDHLLPKTRKIVRRAEAET